jgi:hypothetical protein
MNIHGFIRDYILKPKWFLDFVIRKVKYSLNLPLAPPRRGVGLFSLNFT